MTAITVATTQPGQSGTVKGTGFGSRTNVRLLVGSVDVGYFTTGTAGTFSRTIPAQVAGDYQVSAYSTRGCAVTTWHVAAVVEPPPPPPPTGKVVEFHGGTPDQLVTLGKNLDTDIIEMGGLFAKWAYLPAVDIARPADRPLIIRPAAGEIVTFDGGNGVAPAFRFGWSTPLTNVTFEGPFTFQRYRLDKSGLIMARRYDHAAFHRAIVRDVMGVGELQHVHALYLLATSTGGYQSHDWASDDWDVVGPASRNLNGFHIYDASTHTHVAVRRWHVESVNRVVFGWSGRDVLVDGFVGKDANGGIDASGGDCQGVVTNCKFSNAKTLRWWWPASSKLLDGGGNVAS